jgi:hypothetical protein
MKSVTLTNAFRIITQDLYRIVCSSHALILKLIKISMIQYKAYVLDALLFKNKNMSMHLVSNNYFIFEFYGVYKNIIN